MDNLTDSWCRFYLTFIVDVPAFQINYGNWADMLFIQEEFEQRPTYVLTNMQIFGLNILK